MFLDGWEWELHSLPGGENVHSAVPHKHNVLHCGLIKTTQQELSNDLSASQVEELRVMEGLLYGYALLGFSLGPVNDKALLEICNLNVLFCNAMVFLGTQKARAVLNDV